MTVTATKCPPEPRARIRSVPQSETSECALACLAMVADAWGLNCDLMVLRQRLSATPRGVNLRMLVDFAAALGLAARPVRIGLLRVGELRLPAILHWNMDHFVVLEKVSKDGVTIVDPARGRLRVSWDEASPSFTGVAVELTPTDRFEGGTLRLSRRFRRAWWSDPALRATALGAVWLTMLLQLAIVALPFAYQRLIDAGKGLLESPALMPIVAGIGMMITVQVGSSWLRGVMISRVGALFVHRVTTHIVARIFSLPIAFFHRQMLGDVMARIRSVDEIRRFVTDQAIPVAIDAVVVVATAGLMVRFSPALSLITIGGLGIDATVRLISRRRQRDLATELLEAESRELSRLLESMRAIQAIKLAGREAQRFAVWENDLVQMLNAQARVGRQQLSIVTVSQMVSSLEWAAILAVGILDIGGVTVSTGVLFGFLAYRGMIRERFANFLDSAWSLEAVGVHLRRLDDLMLAEAEPEGGRAAPEADGSGGIRLESVSFRYSAVDPVVIDDVSLDIPAGSSVAFVGPSGGGKSTLVRLILGIERPTSGNILMDGVLQTDIDYRAWRECFGVVMQDDTLLAGSIAENIAFFDATVDMDAVRDAARSAAVHDEIDAMPMEYGTLVGDMGAQLSGGQRQRVLIARALYRKAPVLVFDEGTANLDAESEGRIAAVLSALSPTRILVAHRSQLIEMANIVYEVRRGRVTRIR